MTKEDLIAMARQAGAFPELSTTSEKDVDFLRRFASLVSARTREECADFCDEFQPPPSCNTLERHLWNVAIVTLADAIRAMGERT